MRRVTALSMIAPLALLGCVAFAAGAGLSNPTKAVTEPPSDWSTYHNSELGVELRYPTTWQADSSGNTIYSGLDGFFQLTAAESVNPSAEANCEEVLRANSHKQDRFGQEPALELLKVHSQPACLPDPAFS